MYRFLLEGLVLYISSLFERRYVQSALANASAHSLKWKTPFTFTKTVYENRS
jgi:hypothetical protein